MSKFKEIGSTLLLVVLIIATTKGLQSLDAWIKGPVEQTATKCKD